MPRIDLATTEETGVGEDQMRITDSIITNGIWIDLSPWVWRWPEPEPPPRQTGSNSTGAAAMTQGTNSKWGLMAGKVTNAGVFERISSHREAQFLTIGSLIRDVSQTLANIDFEHDVAIGKLEVSRSSSDQKRFIREKLVAQHHERREPYVALLTELGRQLQCLPPHVH